MCTLKGERILKLSEMGRKLETEEEKVLPFYASSLTQEEQDDVQAAVVESPSEPLASVCWFLHGLGRIALNSILSYQCN